MNVLTDEQALKNLSTNLQRLLSENGTSQSELARGTGASMMAVSYYVRGERMPGVGVLARFAEFFGVTTDSLLSKQPLKKNRQSV